MAGAMKAMHHPALGMSFDDLRAGLLAALEARHVSRQTAYGLELYCYSNSCVYDRAWTPITTLARGIIIHPDGHIVALPFPKFFNVGEREDQTIPEMMPFEVFEKLDGSLIILFFWDGSWRTATKGAFHSPQAQWAADWIEERDLSALDPSMTYLCEAIYPENRIVVAYERRELVLLAAYRADGHELSYMDLLITGSLLGWPVVRRHPFTSIAELLSHTKLLPANEEGFVIRFENGLRLKVKGEEYRRIHALISHLSPLSVWEVMLADGVIDARRSLPEEFWGDFDAMNTILQNQVYTILARVSVDAAGMAHLSDKDVGLRLSQLPEPTRSFIFPYRKTGDLLTGKARQALFRSIRPTANRLEGYVPSYQLARVQDEAT